MCHCWKGFAVSGVLLALLAAPAPASATSCTTQAELQPQDRDALATAGGGLARAVAGQDLATLKAALLPAVAQQWEGISGVVQDAAALMKGGQVELRNLYLLDATSLTAPADTQFFCTSASGSLTVTLTMRCAAAGPLRRGAGRCRRCAQCRPVGLHSGLGRPRQRLEAGRPDRAAGRSRRP